jgi:hypothetical protein
MQVNRPSTPPSEPPPPGPATGVPRGYKWWVVFMLWFVCFFSWLCHLNVPKLKEEFGFDNPARVHRLRVHGVYVGRRLASSATGFAARISSCGCLFWARSHDRLVFSLALHHRAALEGSARRSTSASMSLVSDYHDTRSRALSFHQSSVSRHDPAAGSGMVRRTRGWRTASISSAAWAWCLPLPLQVPA